MGYTSTFANELLVTPFDDKSIVEEEITDEISSEMQEGQVESEG